MNWRPLFTCECGARLRAGKDPLLEFAGALSFMICLESI